MLCRDQFQPNPGGFGCDLLPGHRAGLCIGIMNPFLDGFHENGYVSAGRGVDDREKDGWRNTTSEQQWTRKRSGSTFRARSDEVSSVLWNEVEMRVFCLLSAVIWWSTLWATDQWQTAPLTLGQGGGWAQVSPRRLQGSAMQKHKEPFGPAAVAMETPGGRTWPGVTFPPTVAGRDHQRSVRRRGTLLLLSEEPERRQTTEPHLSKLLACHSCSSRSTNSKQRLKATRNTEIYFKICFKKAVWLQLIMQNIKQMQTATILFIYFIAGNRVSKIREEKPIN